jgi:hypothetical protein
MPSLNTAARFGHVRKPVKCRLTSEPFDRRLPGLYRVHQLPPVFPIAAGPPEEDHSSRRIGRVDAQRFAQRRQHEPAVAALAEDPVAGKCAQQSAQRIGVSADSVCDGLGCQWSVAQCIGNSELRRDIDTLRYQALVIVSRTDAKGGCNFRSNRRIRRRNESTARATRSGGSLGCASAGIVSFRASPARTPAISSWRADYRCGRPPPNGPAMMTSPTYCPCGCVTCPVAPRHVRTTTR